MRTVPEWIGTSDNSPVPPRVKLRIFIASAGICAICTVKICGKLRPAFDHTVALINAPGGNRESNVRLLCVPCHATKTWDDVKEKSAVATKQKKHLGFTKTKRPIGGRGFDKREPQHTASRPIERRS